MRLLDLFEKLEKFEIVNPDQDGSFDDIDAHLINTKSYPQRITNAFSNTPFPFEIYVVNHDYDENEWKSTQNSNTNVMSPNYVRDNFYSGFQHNPNSITLFITNNFADSKQPLTPWIVAHRFAHVVESAARTGNRSSRFNDTVVYFQQSIMKAFEKNGYRLYDIGETYYEIAAMMTTKSARDANHLSRLYEGEAIHELLTQFIINGRISLQTDHITKEKYGDKKKGYGLATDMINLAKQFERRLNKEAANDLSRAIGKIFVI